jgi:hypothetical protein
MSMTLTYDGTAVSLDGERAPDQNYDVSPVDVGGVRRTYLGAAKIWTRYAKLTVTFTWTGIGAAVLGSLRPLYSTTAAITGSGLPSGVFGTTSMSFYSVRNSWNVQPTGLDSYTARLTLEQA